MAVAFNVQHDERKKPSGLEAFAKHPQSPSSPFHSPSCSPQSGWS